MEWKQVFIHWIPYGVKFTCGIQLLSKGRKVMEIKYRKFTFMHLMLLMLWMISIIALASFVLARIHHDKIDRLKNPEYDPFE